MNDPLAVPRDPQLLRQFQAHFRLTQVADPREQLVDIATAFAQLPYENLSKIIRFADAGNVVAARETPAEVLSGHYGLGTGGTCFSLTATLLHLVRSLGFAAEPILADRPYGTDTHCAVLVYLDGRPHLLDPGYLLLSPIDVSECAEQRLATDFNQLRLVPHAQGDQLALHTLDNSGDRHRLTFKLSPVDTGEFLRAWDASFDWDMMHYPLLTRVTPGAQQYQRGTYCQVRQRDQVTRREIDPEELASQIARQFGIEPSIVARALSILRSQAHR